MTASFGTLAWPHFGFARPSFKFEKLRSAHSRVKPRVLKDQDQPLGHLRTVCADVIELALNRLLSDDLFHDHRIAAIHLRNRLP